MNQKRKSSKRVTILLVVLLIAGIAILLYPSFSDWWNSMHQSRAIGTYIDTVANMEKEEYDKMFAEAEEYNRELFAKVNRYDLSEEDKEEYNRILNVTDTGIMGYVEIPAINVHLPIYHGTSEAVLQVAIGHVEGTSLPVGGIGTHSVISGHRGLPSAKLFTDIDQLEYGDKFMIQVLDRTLVYEVDQIRIVLPHELQDINIDPDEDWCTLATCTPYGVNTHRLLVRGKRVPEEEQPANVIAEAVQIEPILVAPLVAAPILLFLLILLFVNTGKQKERESLRTDKERRSRLIQGLRKTTDKTDKKDKE